MNRFPAIKAFVKGRGGAELYENLEVRYVSGHNPDLVVIDSQTLREEKRIDLKKYPGESDLHGLMKAEGFVKIAEEIDDCTHWARKGECWSNSAYMLQNCSAACAALQDRLTDCVHWAKSGECEANPKYMYVNCYRSCMKEELRR